MPLVLWELHSKKAFLQHFYSIFSKSALQKILSLMVSVSYCHWLYKTIEKPRVMSFLTQILCQTAVDSLWNSDGDFKKCRTNANFDHPGFDLAKFNCTEISPVFYRTSSPLGPLPKKGYLCLTLGFLGVFLAIA